MKKKILIIHSSVGLGHKIVAENIAQALRFYSDIDIRLLDITKFYEGLLTKKSTRLYLGLIKNFPWFWRFLYTSKIFNALTLPLRLPFAAAKAEKLREYLAREKPDAILTTQTTATALVSHLKLKKAYQGPLAVTFSDFHFHPYWVYPGVDLYLVMTAEQKQELLSRGISEEKIIMSGLPVDKAFEMDFDAPQTRWEFGFSPDRPLVLLVGGSQGFGIEEPDIRALLETDLELAVLTGANQALFEKLRNLASKFQNLKVFPDLSQTDVAKLFSIASVLITKPGGLSIAEALAKNLPMILIHPLPGMEELNSDYLLKLGIAVEARDSEELKKLVEILLRDQTLYQEQKEKMRQLHRPEAGQRAASAIIDMLQKRD